MKAEKLGLVLGINMVAACLVMQGCKNPDYERAKREGKYPPPSQTVRQLPDDKQVITYVPSTPQRPAPAAEPAAQPQGPVISNMPQSAEPAPALQDTPPAEPAPSAVRKVKPLPTAQAKASKESKVKAASAPAAAAPSTTEYVVKSGDTLSLISKRTNYRQSAILAANPGLNPDRIRVGQKIKLPGAVETAAASATVAKAAAPAAKDAAKDKVKQAAAPAPAAANTKAPVKTKSGFTPYEGPTKEIVVKSGDSVGQIAVSYGISIRALKALNGLKSDALRAGQKLKVPAEKQTPAKAAAAAAKTAPANESPVKPAAAKADGAKAGGAKADGAKAAPEVKDAAAPAPAADAAKPAESAKVEDAAKTADAAKVEEPAPAPAEEAPAQLTHTVKEGEDLVSIAIAYGISPSALMDINNLKPTDEVKPGQVLKLPPNAKPSASNG